MKYLLFCTGLLFLLVIFPGSAFATMYNVKFCIKFEVDYDDAVAGDYWTENNDVKARGIWLYVRRNADAQAPAATIFDNYTNPETGCTTTLSLSSIKTYFILAYSTMKVNNNIYINVKDSESAPLYSQLFNDAFSPDANENITYIYDDDEGNDNSYLGAAVSYALDERPGGVTDDMINVINQPCPSSGASCHVQEKIYISDSSRDNKFVIAHETGHWVGWSRNDHHSWYHNYNYVSSICHEDDPENSHEIFSKEYQTAAVSEGFAQFYATSVWNNPQEDDCEFYHNQLHDYDRDGDLETNHIWNCSITGESQYMWTYCEETFSGKGVEWDWLRFWWSWHTIGDLTMSDIVDIHVDVEDGPENWTAATIYNLLTDSAEANNLNMNYWVGFAATHGVCN